jgi:proline racemase
VRTEGNEVVGVDFVNVPSYVLHRDIPVSTSRGGVTVDVAYGGAIYAHLDAASVGLSVTPGNYADLINIGREVKHLLNATDYAAHPEDDRLSGIYGTIVFDDLGPSDDGDLRQRNVAVFADGEVDRSPCGSGTASRIALLAASGALAMDRQLIHESIVGTVFHARVAQQVEAAGRSAVVPVVSGMAYRTGRHIFELDPADDLGEGFVLR